MFNNKYLKTKIKPYNNTVTTNFNNFDNNNINNDNNKVPKEKSRCIWLFAVVIDSVS